MPYPRTVFDSTGGGAALASVFLFFLTLFALYLTIRAGVRAGIEDAEKRKAKRAERAARRADGVTKADG